MDYLLNQSQFHDFNREMVYQLLIDIIDPKSVTEFVNLLISFGDDRISRAIKATDITQFSKPIEVMHYLLSVADDNNYTERDLLRVLLKILLRKGPEQAAITKTGWFSRFDRPVLVTSLIIVNAVIIILLILFIWRKKRKNE